MRIIPQWNRLQAFYQISEERPTRHQQIVQVLREYPDGLTNDEILDKLNERGIIHTQSVNAVRPRTSELASVGILKEVKSREGKAGRMMSVYVLVSEDELRDSLKGET